MANTPSSYDLTPEGTIRFMDAYDWYLEEVHSNASVLKRMPLLEAIGNNKRRTLEFSSFQDDPQAAMKLERLFREKEIEVFFRWCLREGQLIAYVRDPHDGTHLRLEPGDWIP